MSGRVYLQLKVSGSDVAGESTVTTIGGVDVSQMIECEGYSEAVDAAQDPASRRPTGQRIYQPIKVRKWVDKASPLLQKALCNTEVCEGTFHFFRPSAEDAQMEHFYSVVIEEARISSIHRFLPEASEDVAKAGKPPLEEVCFVFGKCTWTHLPGSTEHTDDWKVQG